MRRTRPLRPAGQSIPARWPRLAGAGGRAELGLVLPGRAVLDGAEGETRCTAGLRHRAFIDTGAPPSPSQHALFRGYVQPGTIVPHGSMRYGVEQIPNPHPSPLTPHPHLTPTLILTLSLTPSLTLTSP